MSLNKFCSDAFITSGNGNNQHLRLATLAAQDGAAIGLPRVQLCRFLKTKTQLSGTEGSKQNILYRESKH